MAVRGRVIVSRKYGKSCRCIHRHRTDCTNHPCEDTRRRHLSVCLLTEPHSKDEGRENQNKLTCLGDRLSTVKFLLITNTRNILCRGRRENGLTAKSHVCNLRSQSSTTVPSQLILELSHCVIIRQPRGSCN